MKKSEKLQKQAFEMNNPDFLRAVANRNFDDMADCYNEMMRYDDLGSQNETDRYFFAGILDGYVISFSLIAKAKINAIGKHFYYGLAKDYIYYTLNEYPEDNDNLVPAFLKKDLLECKKAELTESYITFTPKAVKQLKLSAGDIVKICFRSETIIIDKYEQPRNV